MPFKLRTFGGLSISGEGGAVTGAAAQRRKLALLAVLATGPRGVSRDRLLALFWPESDAEHARHALTQSLSALRRELGREDIFLGTTDLRLNPAIIEADVAGFEAAVVRGELASAVALYAGPFLDAVHLDRAHQSPEFERWVEEERARLAAVMAGALERLAADAEERGEHGRAVAWWRRLAALDPYSGRFAAGLMTALVAAGDTAAALRHAEVYETLLREDLHAEPDAAVAAMVRRLRRAPVAGPGPARPRPGAPPVARVAPDARQLAAAVPAHLAPPASRPPARPLGLGLALASVAVVAGAVLIARAYTHPPLDPNLVAIAPFDVLDPRFELWHEGLVDYLSKSLDGAGPLRTVSPSVVLRHWKGPADPTSARELGRRTGALLVVFGQVVGAGPDSARLRATVLDAATGKTLAEPERTDLADRIGRLADSLTTDVLRELSRAGSAAQIRLSSVGTKSLAALKAFLRGEQLLRRFSLDSAIQAYEEAVGHDSGLALALRRIGLAQGWRGENGGPLGLKAGRSNHGLAPRDSLLILADSLEAASDDSQDSAYWSHRVRKFATLDEASRRYPDDPEVWYELGEARFHLGYVVGVTPQQTLDAFRRAIALDTAFAPAYFHPVQLALDQNDSGLARRYVRAYLNLTTDVPEGAGIRLVAQLLEPTQGDSRDLRHNLAAASANALLDAWRSVQRWPDADEAALGLLGLLATGRRGVGIAADTLWMRYLFATELLYRGHLREARAMVGSRFSVPFAELALLGAIPEDSAAVAFDRWLRRSAGRLPVADPPWVSRCYRSFLAAEWWARRRDTLSLLTLMRRGDVVGTSARSVLERVDARADASVGRAALALTRRDTVGALRRLLAFPDSLCTGVYGSLSPSLAPLQLVRFQLLTALGRDREAARVFDQQVTMPLTVGSVVATLARGRMAERLGDRATARRNYQFVVAVWRNADSQLRPYVEEALLALKRLYGPSP